MFRTMMAVSKSDKSDVAFKVMMAPMAGLLFSRNVTMAKNTVLGFQKDANLEVLLNIVGTAHLPGISKILKKEYGFVEITDKVLK